MVALTPCFLFQRKDSWSCAKSLNSPLPERPRRKHPSFGAHTCERVDKPRGEFFHTNWTGTGGRVASGTYTV